MAMACRSGGRECTGCMECEPNTIDKKIYCHDCGEELSPDNIFYDEGTYVCRDCLLDSHFCYDYEFGDCP